MENHDKRHAARHQGLDSFYESEISVFISDFDLSERIVRRLNRAGFSFAHSPRSDHGLFATASGRKPDLIVIEIGSDRDPHIRYALPAKIRIDNPDVAMITISAAEHDISTHLELNIDRHFTLPVSPDDIIKAAKRALGNKYNYEVGMQFFDALFGMQMCTHRDLHQRTFEHVIRTTKIYAKFLLHLNSTGFIELTSWSLKNCLMASLVHDIGKLLIMHGVLYKEGKLSDFEYTQVKRHCWHSVTALLGGQDIDFFAQSGPIRTVSGYNEKNLGAQVRLWTLKSMRDDESSYEDVESFFTGMSEIPFTHSLNRDLLYIVFRHHDGTTSSYHTDGELAAFSRIIGYPVNRNMDIESPLDIVTNALSLCDMYDALLDAKRDYRRNPYESFFVLFLLFKELIGGKFFEPLLREFMVFLCSGKHRAADDVFTVCADGNRLFDAIRRMHGVFDIRKSDEHDFDNFIRDNRNSFTEFFQTVDERRLNDIFAEWTTYSAVKRAERMEHFVAELNKAEIFSGSACEAAGSGGDTFHMLLDFYYSYSSSAKQRKFIEYLKESVIIPTFDDEVRDKIVRLVQSGKCGSRKEFEKQLAGDCLKKKNLFDAFRSYDVNTLINELNEFIRRS